MTILGINLFLCILYALFLKCAKLKDSDSRKIYFILAFIQIFILRTVVEPNSIPDLATYVDIFDLSKETKVKDILLGEYLMISESGYFLLCKISSLVSDNFHFLLAIISLIWIYSYFNLFKKYSKYFAISIIILLLTEFPQSLFVLRQHLAIAIWLFAYPAIINRNLKNFIFIGIYLWGKNKHKNYTEVQQIIKSLVRREFLTINNISDELKNDYSRIRLPEIVEGISQRDDIIIHTEQWFESKKIKIEAPVEATKIDRENKFVTAVKSGVESRYPYDALILATGDSNNTPAGANLGPIIVGLIIVAIGASFGFMHGYAVNPARDLGPRLFAVAVGFQNNGLTDGSNVWLVPVIGPIVGGVLGAIVYDFTIGKALAGKN